VGKMSRWILPCVACAIAQMLAASPVHAQWCEDVCSDPEVECSQQCNLGGGEYTTCGGAGYSCCFSAQAYVERLGGTIRWGQENFACGFRAVELWRWVRICNDQVVWASDPFCKEVNRTTWLDCCATFPCTFPRSCAEVR
jgi:hypothetical protein